MADPPQGLSIPDAAERRPGASPEPDGRAHGGSSGTGHSDRRKEHYAATGKTISLAQLSAELTALKKQPETAWLKEADSQALQQALKDLHRAFVNFFERRARYPRFKSRKRDQARFRIPQRVKVADGKVYVPKVGWVRIRQSRRRSTARPRAPRSSGTPRVTGSSR